MTWWGLALLSALVVSISSIWEKKILNKEHAIEFSATLALFNAAISGVILYFIGLPPLSSTILSWIYIASIFGTIAFWLVAKGIRHMEISYFSPFLLAGPGVTAILAAIFLGETLSLSKVLGIILLIAGSFILQPKIFSRNIMTIPHFKYLGYISISLILYSLSSLIDRRILGGFDMDPLAYVAVISIFISINFIILLLLIEKELGGIKRGISNFGWPILFIALLTTTHRFLHASAISLAYIAPVVALKRSSVLLDIFLGGKIFHEGHIGRRFGAALIMIIGVIFIIF